MVTSDKIALASMIIALITLPISYYISVRQVKIGLQEQERKINKKTLLKIITETEEFFKIFYAAVKECTGLESFQIQQSLELINPKLNEIDQFVIKTKVMDRLANSIDNLSDIGFEELSISNEVRDRIQSIRNTIAIGSRNDGYIVLGVISNYQGDVVLDELKKSLKKNA
jgi:hypothetical protein